ncbi:MAG: tetratricopeptide repeat protein [Myxococcaceae bacterium]|nr:tetratricopeptide repeat protein [Myxococcaceae bacterium]
MRRLLILSTAMACLGGCSCKGKPDSSAAAQDSGGPLSQQQAPLPAAAETPPPASEVPERAMQLHAAGRRYIEAGQHQEALKSFQEARELAPGWPVPLYDIGLTYLQMKDDPRALESFEALDKLAPQGVSESKRMLDSLRREQDSRVPKGTLREFLEVQRVADPDEARRLLEELTRKAPGFVPAWHELAVSAEGNEEGERLLAKALALEPHAEARGQLLVHRALLLRRRGEHEAARKQLQALIDDPAMPPSVIAEARELLSDSDSPRP